jgi:hypothetical protein
VARTGRGYQLIYKSKELLTKARTVRKPRQARPAALPLVFNMSIDQTSSIIGESKVSRGGRRRENLSLAEEAVLLAPFIEKAKVGGILIVTEIKKALEARLGHRISLASAYNLMVQVGKIRKH